MWKQQGGHLGVSKALHGILLAIMALYWNLNLLRLQAMQIGVFPLFQILQKDFQDNLPAVEVLNKPGPQGKGVKSLFGRVQSAVFRLWGKENKNVCMLSIKALRGTKRAPSKG